MLKFYNTIVILNIELNNSISEAYVTELPFSDSWGDSRNFLGEVNIKKFNGDEDLNKCSCIALTISEFYAFTKEWYFKSQFEKFEGSTFEDWFTMYLQSILNMYKASQIRVDNISPCNPCGYTDLIAISTLEEALKSKNYRGGDNIVKVKKFPTPEFSWIIEDYMVKLLYKRRSLYMSTIMDRVEQNIRDIQYCMSCFNTVYPCTNVDLKLTKSPDSDMIISESQLKQSLTTEQAILYFQTPYIFRRVDTNYLYIKYLLNQYRGKQE